MRIDLSCGVLAACVALTACGGGGGGGGAPAASGPPAQLLITGSNAQAAGAHALDAVQDTSDAQGAANLVTGVQVAPGGTPSGIPLSRRLSDIALALAPRATPAAPTGVAVDQVGNCSQGGTVRVVGTVASAAGLVAGDSVTLAASDCLQQLPDGTVARLSGTLRVDVAAGSAPDGASSYDVTLQFTASAFTVSDGSGTASLDGDMRLRRVQTAATQATLTVTGARLSQALPGRTTTWVDYTQVITQNGSTFGSRLDGTLQTTSTRLAPGGGSFLVATPTAVTWQAGGLPQAGVVTLTGANRSRATLTVAGGGAVTVAIDTNGDGTPDATQTTTVTALRALL